jgi:hypothetical protein
MARRIGMAARATAPATGVTAAAAPVSMAGMVAAGTAVAAAERPVLPAAVRQVAAAATVIAER